MKIGDIKKFKVKRFHIEEMTSSTQPIIFEEWVNGIIVRYDDNDRMAIIWYFDTTEEKIKGRLLPYSDLQDLDNNDNLDLF